MGYAQVPQPSPFGKQFNIMGLVGNGFDIQVMHEYDQSTTMRYQDFYYFMKMKNVASSNLIVREMDRAIRDEKANWSDIEDCIASLASNGVGVSDIRDSLNEVRRHFSEFLNMVVSTSLLSQLSDDAQDRAWAKESLSRFLTDIDRIEELRKIPFGMRKGNYDLYNFYFVNFNYTSLLDDYIYMDPDQFDPVPHSTVDTNFFFNTDPKRLSSDRWNYSSSSYVEMQVVHPHGYQDIPRSLLFGTNGDGNPRSPGAKLAKTYWARIEQRYSHLFEDTDLFVIFGCSLGATDSWWWENIAASLANAEDGERALLLYWWNESSEPRRSEDEVRELFFDAADVERSLRGKLSNRISVVSYTDHDDRVWLNTVRSRG